MIVPKQLLYSIEVTEISITSYSKYVMKLIHLICGVIILKLADKLYLMLLFCWFQKCAGFCESHDRWQDFLCACPTEASAEHELRVRKPRPDASYPQKRHYQPDVRSPSVVMWTVKCTFDLNDIYKVMWSILGSSLVSFLRTELWFQFWCIFK